MKTIYWLHSHFLLSTGGTRFIFEVISQLSKTYRVVVIVEKTNEEWKKKYTEINVEIIETLPLSSNNILYWLFLPIFIVISYIKSKTTIKKNSVVISSMFPMNIIGNLVSNKHIFYCFEPYAFFYDTDLKKSFNKLKQVLLKLLTTIYSPLDKLAVKNVTKLLAINPSVGKWIHKIYKRDPDNYSFLGVQTDFFKPSAKPIKNKTLEYIRLFHSTDFTPLKGTHYLLAAMKHIKKYPHIQLLISESISNPEVKKDFIAYIKTNDLDSTVTFVNHIPYSELPNYYSYCDIYCFTGAPQSTGATAASLSVLEASASGLSVIRSIGNDDEVIDNVTGLIIDPRNSINLAKSIIALSKNKALRKKMGENGRKHILQKYTWDKVATVFKYEIEML